MPTLCWELRERNEIGKFDRKYLLFPILLVQYGAIQSETCTTKSCIKQDIIPCKKRCQSYARKRRAQKGDLQNQRWRARENSLVMPRFGREARDNGNTIPTSSFRGASLPSPLVPHAQQWHERRGGLLKSFFSLFITYLSILFTRLPMFIYLYLCAC